MKHFFPNLVFKNFEVRGRMPKCLTNKAMLQVLDYVQQSKESFDKDQLLLFKRMQEYKKQVYQESRLSLNGPYGSPSGESVHPFSRISNEVVDVVNESAANGKVFWNTFPSFSENMQYFILQLFNFNSCYWPKQC